METKTDKLVCRDCKKYRYDSRVCLAGKWPAESDPVCADGFEPKKNKAGKADEPVETTCEQCMHYDAIGSYCFHNSVTRTVDEGTCNGFELKALGNGKVQTPPPVRKARYVETKMIALELLDKHPDAEAFGADIEDRVAMSSSVIDVGMLDPISVQTNDGRYLILDGCGRYDTLKAAGAKDAMCIVFDLEGLTAREFALHRNTMGRKVTTGQRLMCYLSLNQNAVLESLDAPEGGRPKKTASREAVFTVAGIAARLGVSKNDVSAGVELLKTMSASTENEEADGAASEVYDAVIDGRLPIRRWKPALAGKVKTKGTAKAATDYAKLATRTMISLGTVFENWQEIPLAGREPILDKIEDLLDVCPDDIKTILIRRYQLPASKKAK